MPRAMAVCTCAAGGLEQQNGRNADVKEEPVGQAEAHAWVAPRRPTSMVQQHRAPCQRAPCQRAPPGTCAAGSSSRGKSRIRCPAERRAPAQHAAWCHMVEGAGRSGGSPSAWSAVFGSRPADRPVGRGLAGSGLRLRSKQPWLRHGQRRHGGSAPPAPRCRRGSSGTWAPWSLHCLPEVVKAPPAQLSYYVYTHPALHDADNHFALHAYTFTVDR